MSYMRVLKFVMRHTTVVNAYAAVEVYGFPRAYRRMAEVLKKDKHLTYAQKRVISDNLKASIRMPSTAYSFITESHTAAFLIKEAETLASTTHIHPPPVVLAIAEMLFKKTPFGRVIDILKRAAKKRELEALKQQLFYEQHHHPEDHVHDYDHDYDHHQNNVMDEFHQNTHKQQHDAEQEQKVH